MLGEPFNAVVSIQQTGASVTGTAVLDVNVATGFFLSALTCLAIVLAVDGWVFAFWPSWHESSARECSQTNAYWINHSGSIFWYPLSVCQSFGLRCPVVRPRVARSDKSCATLARSAALILRCAPSLPSAREQPG